MVALALLSSYISGAWNISAQAQGKHYASSDLVFRGTQRTWPAHEIRPLPLPDGRLVLSIANAVYMLDAHGKQLWKYENETLTSEPAFNAITNEIAVVMHDLQAVRLDATTGKVKWKAESAGRGGFARVLPYVKGFLVVVDMSGYRGPEDRSTSDRLEYWGESESDFWYIDFPNHAELVVNEKKFYALIRRQTDLRLRELHPPSANKPR
jgi:outer membrane protein assembly factor BamB